MTVYESYTVIGGFSPPPLSLLQLDAIFGQQRQVEVPLAQIAGVPDAKGFLDVLLALFFRETAYALEMCSRFSAAISHLCAPHVRCLVAVMAQSDEAHEDLHGRVLVIAVFH